MGLNELLMDFNHKKLCETLRITLRNSAVGSLLTAKERDKKLCETLRITLRNSAVGSLLTAKEREGLRKGTLRNF